MEELKQAKKKVLDNRITLKEKEKLLKERDDLRKETESLRKEFRATLQTRLGKGVEWYREYGNELGVEASSLQRQINEADEEIAIQGELARQIREEASPDWIG